MVRRTEPVPDEGLVVVEAVVLVTVVTDVVVIEVVVLDVEVTEVVVDVVTVAVVANVATWVAVSTVKLSVRRNRRRLRAPSSDDVQYRQSVDDATNSCKLLTDVGQNGVDSPSAVAQLLVYSTPS